jgi:putative ABC transport system permease protein
VFRNYFAAALRNLMRNRAVATINIAGLAIAFAAALLIALYVRYERSYEQFLPDHERIYLFSTDVRNSERGLEHQDTSSHRVAAWLKLDFPEIERVARLRESWTSVGRNDREFNEQVYNADPDFFRIIRLRAVAGDLDHALDEPQSVAISRAMARKYFGRDNPIGEILKYQRIEALRVTAVFEDLPGNSHFNFRIVSSTRGSYFDQLDSRPDGTEFETPVFTYFQLRPGSDIAKLREKLPEFAKRHWPANTASAFESFVLPIADIHLSPDVVRALKPRGNSRTLHALTLVGIFIVLIAVFNFVNLTTARAAHRSVEVGVRKLAGARRRDLALQFMGESFLYVALAMLLAMSLVELALPAFRALLDPGEKVAIPPTIAFDYWRNPSLLGWLLGATVFVGVIAAAYPALVLSSFRPASVLKGSALQSAGGSRVRAWLATLQFAMLIGLIFATTVIVRQTNYALRSAMRIDTSQVVIYFVASDNGAGAPAEPFRNTVAALPGVIDITASAAVPTNVNINALPFATTAGQGNITVLQVAPVAWNFFDFYRVRLLAGRTFSRDQSTDRYVITDKARPLSVVVNETAAKRLGYARVSDAIGKTLRNTYWPPAAPPAPEPATIVGVVADFPISSVRREIEPAVYFTYEPMLSMLSIRINGRTAPETLEGIRRAWKEVGQPRAQEGWFLDENYRQLYAEIILQQKTLTLFAGCAVFLAALGLFGLSIYTAQRRTKEIGIRKVMGAGTADVMRLLLWAFIKPVLWASLIAWPVAAWLMLRWLEGFVYRVPLGWWWLPIASLTALIIALMTVSAHSYAVARQQPAGALRYE